MPDNRSATIQMMFWQMSRMEQQIWATILAQHWQDDDAGVSVADACLQRLREVTITRDERLEPEYEMAKAGLHMELAEFAVWYPIQHRLHLKYTPGPYVAPTREAIEAAYERFARSLCDFW